MSATAEELRTLARLLDIVNEFAGEEGLTLSDISGSLYNSDSERLGGVGNDDEGNLVLTDVE